MDESMDSGRSAPPGACPDPILLAGFAEGRLLAVEREPLEVHLARCEDCRTGVAAFVLEGAAAAVPTEAPAPRRGSLLRRTAWFAIPAAAAAVLLVALSLQGRRATGDRPLDDAVLVAAATDLAKARPEVFGEFRPLSREERLAMPLAPKRGGALGLRVPCGKVLEARPAFRWEPVPGVARWKVSLLTAAGKRVWTAESAEPSLAYPAAEAALEPGRRYLFEVSGEGPLGPERARRTFDVASVEESAAAVAAAREIADRAPRAAAPLLEAHWLLRAGLAAAAEAPARRAHAADPSSTPARETLHLVLETLGEFDEAEALLGDAPAGGGR
jgi:hypothetical protein